MKICDMCGEKLPTEEECEEEAGGIKICLGGTEQTYELCFDCAEKVEKFIQQQKNKK